MNDFYPNTAEDIKSRVERLRSHVEAAGIDMEIDAAAEYYLDEHMMQMLDDRQELLTFGDRYLLFETSFLKRTCLSPGRYLSDNFKWNETRDGSP